MAFEGSQGPIFAVGYGRGQHGALATNTPNSATLLALSPYTFAGHEQHAVRSYQVATGDAQAPRGRRSSPPSTGHPFLPAISVRTSIRGGVRILNYTRIIHMLSSWLTFLRLHASVGELAGDILGAVVWSARIPARAALHPTASSVLGLFKCSGCEQRFTRRPLPCSRENEKADEEVQRLYASNDRAMLATQPGLQTRDPERPRAAHVARWTPPSYFH
uniref:Uncharacterized protein n=1 Tax=Oryza punctata TaxID=4537 RepID=A0A0E0L257_ORYPU